MSSSMTLKRGDDWVLSVALTDNNGDPVSLSGCSVRMDVRAGYDSATATLSASTSGGEITIDDPASGVFVVRFVDTVTSEVEPGRYLTDVEITWADGSVTSSETWQITVLPDITRDAA